MSTEALRIKYPLKEQKIIKKTLASVGPFPVVFLIIGPVFFGIAGLATAVALSAVIVTAVYFYQKAYFRNYFYDLTEKGLIIKKGVFSSNEVTVPLNKMQDIYLDQDLLDRIFGLWDLHISSASDVSGFEAHIDGVSEADGRAMKDMLLARALSRPQAMAGPIPSQQFRPESIGVLVAVARPILSLFVFMIFFSFLWPLFLIGAIVSIPLSILEFRAIRYELRHDGVFIRRGFIQPKESLFLYRNIQDVEESRDVMSLVFGLRDLTMKTMTSLSARDARMPNLSQENSAKIREDILRRVRTELKEVVQAQPSLATSASSAPAQAPSAASFASSSPQQPIHLTAPAAAHYENKFLKSALYLVLVNLVFAAVIVGLPALILVLIDLGLALMGAAAFGGIVFLIALATIAGSLSSLISRMLSYSYELTPLNVIIRSGILSRQERRIDYRKLQDILLNVSFHQSFAGLGTVELDTGSKELTAQGQQTGLASASVLVESVPDLDLVDAVKVKETIASYMGISLTGLWKDPLSRRIPLETIKPVKKTLWWVVFLLPVLVVIMLLPLSGMDALKVLAAILFVIVIGVKYAYERVYYRKYLFDATRQVLAIKKGVYGSREIIIPYSKIQDVFVSQDLLDRIFHLRDVYVSTVTGRSILNAHIDGVSENNAEVLAMLILKNVKESD